MILDAITAGVFEPGDALPHQRDLAAQLEISRPVVIQALDVLRRAGIVRSRRGLNGGTFVDSLENLPEVLRSLHAAPDDDIRSVLEVRRGLETAASVLAAQRASDADLRHLEALAEELALGLDRPIEEIWATDMRFHLAVAASTRSQLLTEFLTATINNLTVIRRTITSGCVGWQQGVEHHLRHAAALRTRDLAAIVPAVDDHLAALEQAHLGERLSVGPPSTAAYA